MYSLIKNLSFLWAFITCALFFATHSLAQPGNHHDQRERGKANILSPPPAPWVNLFKRPEGESLFYHILLLYIAEESQNNTIKEHCHFKEYNKKDLPKRKLEILKEKAKEHFITTDTCPEFFTPSFMWAAMTEFHYAIKTQSATGILINNTSTKNNNQQKNLENTLTKNDKALFVFFEACGCAANMLNGLEKCLWFLWLDHLIKKNPEKLEWRTISDTVELEDDNEDHNKPDQSTPLSGPPSLLIKKNYTSVYSKDNHIQSLNSAYLKNIKWIHEKGSISAQAPYGCPSHLLWVLLQDIEDLFFESDKKGLLTKPRLLTKDEKKNVFNITCFLGRRDKCLPFIIQHTLRTIFSRPELFNNDFTVNNLARIIDHITRYQFDWRGWLFSGPFTDNCCEDEKKRYLDAVANYDVFASAKSTAP